MIKEDQVLTKEKVLVSKKICRPTWMAHFIVLIALILCQLIWFGPIIRKIGFYLDDWSTFADLYAGQQNWQSLLQISLRDPRIITRPIESIVYVGSWLAFHDQPFWHHLLNCFFEVMTAFVLYLVLCRLSGNRALAFIASLLMLVYPSHDATHYWVTTNTITLSLAMYLLSLWQAVKAVQDEKRTCFLYSNLAFLASLLTYEAFLPLISITGICLLFLYRKKYRWGDSWLKSVIALAPSLVGVLAIYYYQRVYLLEHLNKGFHHTLKFSLPHMFDVIQAGFSQTILPYAMSVFLLRAQESFCELNVFKCCTLALLAAIVALTLFLISDDQNNLFHPYAFIGLGLTIMICSYAVFAASPEYSPVIDSIMNRINIGASVGSAMILSGLVGLLTGKQMKSRKATSILLTAMVSPLIIFFILADWGWSIPWFRSWTFQKYIVSVVKNNKERFKNCDVVILANCKRYVMWSPLFDGSWDFQSMLRMYLGAPHINATVVSDRLTITKNIVKDVSCGYLCAEYPFKRLMIFIPNPKQWIKIDSASEFIEAIQLHDRRLGITEDTIERWKKELLLANN